MLDFFRENFVVHTHIEKTAGSTLSRGFIQAFGPDRVWDIRGPKRKKPEFLSPEERREIYVLTGHFHYDGGHIKYFDRTPIYIACVRPPLDRYRSAYDFVRVRPNHPGHARVGGKTLRQTVEDLAKSPNPRVNVMARALSKNPHIDAPNLFRHIEEKYLIVTPHRRVNDTLNALVPLLGGNPPNPDLYRNKTTDRSSEDLGDMAQWFADANRLDAELVEFVEANYDRWLKLLPERLAALQRRPLF